MIIIHVGILIYSVKDSAERGIHQQSDGVIQNELVHTPFCVLIGWIMVQDRESMNW